jgi:hypothetical protein
MSKKQASPDPQPQAPSASEERTEAVKQPSDGSRNQDPVTVDPARGDHVPTGRNCTETTEVAGQGSVHPPELTEGVFNTSGR